VRTFDHDTYHPFETPIRRGTKRHYCLRVSRLHLLRLTFIERDGSNNKLFQLLTFNRWGFPIRHRSIIEEGVGFSEAVATSKLLDSNCWLFVARPQLDFLPLSLALKHFAMIAICYHLPNSTFLSSVRANGSTIHKRNKIAL
jgi:hypothetical protein